LRTRRRYIECSKGGDGVVETRVNNEAVVGGSADFTTQNISNILTLDKAMDRVCVAGK
jgi:hypothetical protein